MWRPLLLCCPFVTWYLINPPVSLSLNKESSSPPVRRVYFRHIGQFIWWQGCGKVSWVPFLLHETPAKFLLQTSPSNTMSVEINFSITSAAAIIRSSEAQKGKRGKSVKEIYLLAKQLLPRHQTRGALHKIGHLRNVPTVGTFVIKFNFNLLINIPTEGTFRKWPILCNAPQGLL